MKLQDFIIAIVEREGIVTEGDTAQHLVLEQFIALF